MTIQSPFDVLLSPQSELFKPARHELPTRLEALLDETHRMLADDDIGGMDNFVEQLNVIRRMTDPMAWDELIARLVAPHPICSSIHEEPFSHRAFRKPRGYPGDAPLLDLIYRENPTPETLTPLGARLYEWAGQQPGCISVRERRTILASLIDRVASEVRRPRILSLACGHLREAQSAKSVRAGSIGEFVGIDQDSESLALVGRELGAYRVTPVRMTVRRFLGAPTSLGTFNLVYSAGLYDYLADNVAAAVTRALFAAVQPGGTLVVANFAPELRDIGYMEAIMDWRLIYRSEADVERFTAYINPADIAESSMTRDSGENVIYLTLRKA